MSDLSPDERYQLYKAVEQRVRARFNRRKEFFSHLIAYLVFTAGAAGIWPGIDQFGEGVIGILTAITIVGWTMGVLIHLAQYAFDEWSEQAIDAELEKAGLSAYRQAKLKRRLEEEERAMRLGEDGELVEAEDDYQESPFYDKAQ